MTLTKKGGGALGQQNWQRVTEKREKKVNCPEKINKWGGGVKICPKKDDPILERSLTEEYLQIK